MGEHQLTPGRDLIDAVVEIGRALGYVVIREFPVQPSRTMDGPAVDVAWLREATSSAPLFLFEIESEETPRIVFNAMKVYSQPSAVFERPLYFFHIVLDARTESAVLEGAEAEYSKHNYRGYRLNRGDLTGFLCDVFRQHHRVRDTIDLEAVMELFAMPGFRGADLSVIYPMVERLGFRTNYLSAYLRAATAPAHSHHLVRALRASPQGGIGQVRAPYPTFLGEWFGTQIHNALLCTLQPSHAQECVAALSGWQTSEPISQIGPHFGLSREYDSFICLLAPAFLAMLAALMKEIPSGLKWATAQLETLVEDSEPTSEATALFAELWLLHLAASGSNDKMFEQARSRINARGGAPEAFVLVPPSRLAEHGDDELGRALSGVRKMIASMDDFLSSRRVEIAAPASRHEAIVSLAAQTLLNEGASLTWARDIVALLL